MFLHFRFCFNSTHFDAVVYTVEWQKRGLPHAHILLFLKKEDHAHIVNNIDNYICAEIPDQTADPELYEAVKNFMIHGPCGKNFNTKSPCLGEDGKCTKYFPVEFNERTYVQENGYYKYMRRNTGAFIQKGAHKVDNGFVVPYNIYLLLRYNAHINIEFCNQSQAIKYLFKYISKGSDRICVGINDDEVERRIDCRYISTYEAIWRIFSYDIHYRTPPVERLAFHLKGEQSVSFRDDDDLDEVVDKATIGQTQFTKWMEYNRTHDDAKDELYADFTMNHAWDRAIRDWHKRKGDTFAFGRIYHVPIQTGELYFLRVMLNHIRGAKFWEDLRTVNEVTYSTHKEACYALGLLDDDKEYVDAIKTASEWRFSDLLRRLFCNLLHSNSMAMPNRVWEQTWRFLADDIARQHLGTNRKPGNILNFAILYLRALYYTSNILWFYISIYY